MIYPASMPPMPTLTPEQLAKLPKWALAHLEAVEKIAGPLAALRFTDPVEPDIVPSREDGFEEVQGWLPSGGNTLGTIGDYMGAEDYLSTCSSHRPSKRRHGGSHGGRALFSTRLAALRKVRNVAEWTAAKALHRIDKMIAEEMANPTPLNPNPAPR